MHFLILGSILEGRTTFAVLNSFGSFIHILDKCGKGGIIRPPGGWFGSRKGLNDTVEGITLHPSILHDSRLRASAENDSLQRL